MSRLRPPAPLRSRVLSIQKGTYGPFADGTRVPFCIESPPVRPYRRRRHEAPAAGRILGATRSLPALRRMLEMASAFGRVEVLS